MFKKFVMQIALAETKDDLYEILDGKNGVDIMFQKEKLTWKEHEVLYKLASVHKAADFTVIVDMKVFKK